MPTTCRPATPLSTTRGRRSSNSAPRRSSARRWTWSWATCAPRKSRCDDPIPSVREEAAMYARIAMFEGEGSDRLDDAIGTNRRQIEGALESPPEGLEAVREVWMLVDREAGRSVDITLFDTEEGLRRGDEALNRMSP